MKPPHLFLRISSIVLFLCIMTFDNFGQTPAANIPNFVFFNLDNTPFTNRNLVVGKEILFVFFDVTCDHCRQTIKTLNTRRNECKNIAIYLISLDDKAKIFNFLNQNGTNLLNEKNVTILLDLREQFIKRFGPRKYPSVFLYSTEKKLILYDDEDLYLAKFFKIINASKK